ncbi:MAG: [FeFe] hydrogenase H-cluster radical SAM maturase HydG [Rikenellaceae bacterium]|nr:[FeFe] hydrogenase H-cluster radical SAM maturase HydG [Rikenellaceae bacterium]
MFKPQIYNIPDRPGEPFIDPEEIRSILALSAAPTPDRVREVAAKSLALQRLSLADTAVLLNAAGPDSERVIFDAAERLKREVYGDRIVVFAPLYIGSRCVNDCTYCGFRASNRETVRRTLSEGEVRREVGELARTGQKRLILVFGEHPDYSPEFIARMARTVYETRNDGDRINRVNINAAPLSAEGFRIVGEAGIGTYQIFQETYDPEVYARVHGRGPKGDYAYRLTAMDRAVEAGIDDVGLGVLFGLGDWRYEVLSLVRHTNHLEACFGVGPHTISFPRIRPATNLDTRLFPTVDDADFRKIIAVLRLAVPYAGLILTAREPAALRDELIRYGISQIDAGTRLEVGGYSETGGMQELSREQFELSDARSLRDIVAGLVEGGYIPSFCTACYRKGRTGEHFMQFASTGHIKKLCTPNALLTFAEFLEGYASGPLYDRGWALIEERAAGLEEGIRTITEEKLRAVRNGGRDEFL